MSILKKHFPMIRDREDVVNEISSNSNLKSIFDTWEAEQQGRFLVHPFSNTSTINAA